MTQPYYYIPQRFIVPSGSTATRRRPDLDGKRIGTCTSCTVESYLQGHARRSRASTSSRRSRTRSRRLRRRGSRHRRLAAGEVDRSWPRSRQPMEAIKDGQAVAPP